MMVYVKHVSILQIRKILIGKLENKKLEKLLSKYRKKKKNWV